MASTSYFNGVWTMLVTPFNQQGEIDFEALGRLIDAQIAAGIAGLLALGSTGEFYALSPLERRGVLSYVVERVKGRAKLAAGINGGSTREIIGHANVAADLGYRHVLLAPPYYSLPAQDHLAAHFSEVARNSSLDIILYDNPAQVGVSIGLQVLEDLRNHKNIIGIKEAGGSIARALEIQERFSGRYEVISGVDDLALDMLFWGVQCWMSGPSNFIPQHLIRIHSAVTSGGLEDARRDMRRILPLIRVIETGKYVAKVKHCCNVMGMKLGDARPPIFGLNTDEQTALTLALNQLLRVERG